VHISLPCAFLGIFLWFNRGVVVLCFMALCGVIRVLLFATSLDTSSCGVDCVAGLGGGVGVGLVQLFGSWA